MRSLHAMAVGARPANEGASQKIDAVNEHVAENEPMRWLDLVPMTTARVTIQEIGDGRPGCHGEVSHDAPADSAGVVTDRHSYEAEGGETVRSGKPYWFSHETKHWRAQRFKSLSRCLNPKYRKPK